MMNALVYAIWHAILGGAVLLGAFGGALVGGKLAGEWTQISDNVAFLVLLVFGWFVGICYVIPAF